MDRGKITQCSIYICFHVPGSNRQPRCYFESVKPFRKKTEHKNLTAAEPTDPEMDFIHFHSGCVKSMGFPILSGGVNFPMRFTRRSLVGSLGPFWIINSEGAFCSTRKLNSLEPKWPLFWLEKALFWLIDLQKGWRVTCAPKKRSLAHLKPCQQLRSLAHLKRGHLRT